MPGTIEWRTQFKIIKKIELGSFTHCLDKTHDNFYKFSTTRFLTILGSEMHPNNYAWPGGIFSGMISLSYCDSIRGA